MPVGFLKAAFAEASDCNAFAGPQGSLSYAWLLSRLEAWRKFLIEKSVAAGDVVMLEASQFPETVALLLALLDHRAIVGLLPSSNQSQWQQYCSLAQAVTLLRPGKDGACDVSMLGYSAQQPLFLRLRESGQAGMVLFTSGSTGENKGTVIDAARFLKKFRQRRRNLKTLVFLPLDHIGGLDTLFYCLSNTSCMVFPENQLPDSVCRAVQEHQVEVLPVAPSFLNLLLISGAHLRYDLRSLKCITYGGEVMPEGTLRRVSQAFPGVKLLQKYGATEFGALHSRSKSSDTLWLRLGGEGFQTRIVNGILEVKADSAMLGYLNAPSPFTEDGWIRTGDLAECDGEFIRILGRENDLINVAGRKVFPAEVESVISEVENVSEVVVYGEPNAITGNIVCARIRISVPEDEQQVIRRVQWHCQRKLENYKVPVKLSISEKPLHGDRFKMDRVSRSGAK